MDKGLRVLDSLVTASWVLLADSAAVDPLSRDLDTKIPRMASRDPLYVVEQ